MSPSRKVSLEMVTVRAGRALNPTSLNPQKTALRPAVERIEGGEEARPLDQPGAVVLVDVQHEDEILVL
jgi:hypothetical protein